MPNWSHRSDRSCKSHLSLLVLAATLTACHHPHSPRLPELGYLWQRDWTPAVLAGFREAEERTAGVVILGAELALSPTPHAARANIPWDALKGQNVSLALRVSPYDGPFADNDAAFQAIAAETQRLLTLAQTHGVQPREFQLDFDCAQKKLPGYAIWVSALRRLIHPLSLVITALPSWLGEPAFPVLAQSADGYVLQVHSVPTLAETGRASLCDTTLARKWIARASALGLPFSVSLPAYWCVAGYGPTGSLLGVAMDSVQPAWPPGTSLLEFASSADDLSNLVASCQRSPPAHLTSLLWYRLPIPTDRRNWRWPTLAAVMAGRHPAHRIDAICEPGNPVDISVVNHGEAEERVACTIALTWTGAQVTAGDTLPGWTLSLQNGQAAFSTTPGNLLRLSPGDRRSIGWLRYDKVTAPRWQVQEQNPPAQ